MLRGPLGGVFRGLGVSLGLMEWPAPPRQATPHRSPTRNHDKKMVLRGTASTEREPEEARDHETKEWLRQ